MERITSRENERVKRAVRIAASAGARSEESLFFAEGRKLCFDLAAVQRPVTAFYTEALLAACPEAEHLAAEGFLVADGVAAKLAGTKGNQGLFCLFALPEASFDQLRPEKGLLLCEEVQNPANVGAVIRSAAAFGYGGVALSPGCADPFGPKALRASAGALLRLPVLTGAPLPALAARLRGEGGVLYGAALGEDALTPAEVAPRGAFALLVGNEGAGLSQEALALCDARVLIPMENGVESLNAAVAASVLMYTLAR